MAVKKVLLYLQHYTQESEAIASILQQKTFYNNLAKSRLLETITIEEIFNILTNLYENKTATNDKDVVRLSPLRVLPPK